MSDISVYKDVDPHVLLFVERRSFPDWSIIRQQIDFHDLTFIVGGRAVYTINDQPYEVRAGDMMYVPPGSWREARTYPDDPVHAYAFNFAIASSGMPKLPFPVVSRVEAVGELQAHIKEFNQAWLAKQAGYEIHTRALFLLILHRLLLGANRQDGNWQPDKRIAKARAYVAEHYAETIDLPIIAAMSGLHPVYFSKLFKQDSGYGFKQYLNIVRINNAEMMLMSGEFTVSEVALRCGFNDISYFSNVFKSIKGFPPSVIRSKGL